LVLEELAPDGLARDALARDALALEAVVPEAVVPEAVVPEGRAVVLDRDDVGWAVEAAVAGRVGFPVGDVAGLNVATDSIAPATRHTARMLASSGRTVPCPAKGPASRRSRFRRRFARSSRW
jgi:hypothetical protein